jgi:Tfp pilus assembly protein FimV
VSGLRNAAAIVVQIEAETADVALAAEAVVAEDEAEVAPAAVAEAVSAAAGTVAEAATRRFCVAAGDSPARLKPKQNWPR